MNALSGVQLPAASTPPRRHSRRQWPLRLTAAAIVAGAAFGPVAGSAAARTEHHHAHRSAHHRTAKRGSLRLQRHGVKGHKVTVPRPHLSSAATWLDMYHTTIWWPGGSVPSADLRGAISTAPRGAASRKTTYVSLPSGDTWQLPAAPGKTLYYGVEINGRWSANEKEVSWPATSPSKTTNGTPPKTSSSSASTSATPSASSGNAGTATPTSTTSSSPMMVGLNEQGWGTPAASDIASTFKLDRMDVAGGENASDFWTRGVAVDMLFSGPYNTGGVSALNPVSWAQNTLSTFQSQCNGSAVNCPAVEVLNEPYGSWFWGANAMSSTNEAAYAHLLVDTWTAFHSQYGAASPKILAAYTTGSWWQGIEAAVPNINDYVDAVTVHPYGGTGSVASSALGDQGLVEAAHQATGKPLWVTEFGWPTAVGQPATGDSLQWTDTQQATNTYNFVNWLRGLGYVSAATDFNYRDYGTNAFYGVETSSGAKKPAWTALSEAADQQSCTVCS